MTHRFASAIYMAALLPASPAFSQALAASSDAPLTPGQRVDFVLRTTFDPGALFGHALSAGFGTGIDSPSELGPHWSGFGRRYLNNMSTSVLGNAIEAGVGAAWGEDPRYLPAATGSSLRRRFFHAAAWTVLARDGRGNVGPAYARFIAIPASNAISDAWRPASETGADHVLERSALGFAAQFAGNEWHEFWPDLKKHVFKR